ARDSTELRAPTRPSAKGPRPDRTGPLGVSGLELLEDGRGLLGHAGQVDAGPAAGLRARRHDDTGGLDPDPAGRLGPADGRPVVLDEVGAPDLADAGDVRLVGRHAPDDDAVEVQALAHASSISRPQGQVGRPTSSHFWVVRAT